MQLCNIKSHEYNGSLTVSNVTGRESTMLTTVQLQYKNITTAIAIEGISVRKKFTVGCNLINTLVNKTFRFIVVFYWLVATAVIIEGKAHNMQHYNTAIFL